MLFDSKKHLRIKFRIFFFFGLESFDLGMRTPCRGGAHTSLINNGSFVALMVAGVITLARGSLVRFEKHVYN